MVLLVETADIVGSMRDRLALPRIEPEVSFFAELVADGFISPYEAWWKRLTGLDIVAR